jgi:23S rRNA (adenine2503-C2)-methyltransferase
MISGTSDTPGPAGAETPLHPLALGAEAFIARAKREHGVARPLAEEVYAGFHREGRTSHPRLPAAMNAALAGLLPPVVQSLRDTCAEGEVVKFLTRVGAGARTAEGRLVTPGGPGWSALRATESASSAGAAPADAARSATPDVPLDVPLDVESVIIPMVGKRGVLTHTLCVSSQVGCAMGCVFCETAQMGLVRSLRPYEIVAQWWNAAHAFGVRPSNIVFMGMGEPMDNLDNVLDAIEVLIDHRGPRVPVSKITISTVGRVDGIRAMAERVHRPGWHRLNLAVSLNAPNDDVRDAIMPINRRYDMRELQAAMTAFPVYGGGKLCVEYVLIPGVNDSREHAAQVAEFVKPIDEHYSASREAGKPRCMLNLIPYNPRRNSPWPAPTEAGVDEFLGWLMERGVFAKRRRTKGRAMMGACGQLGAAHIRQRRVVDLTVSAS